MMMTLATGTRKSPRLAQARILNKCCGAWPCAHAKCMYWPARAVAACPAAADGEGRGGAGGGDGGESPAPGRGGGDRMHRSRSGQQSVLSRTVAGPLLNRPPPAATAAQLQLGGEGGGGCGGGGWGWQET